MAKRHDNHPDGIDLAERGGQIIDGPSSNTEGHLPVEEHAEVIARTCDDCFHCSTIFAPIAKCFGRGRRKEKPVPAALVNSMASSGGRKVERRQ